MMSENSRDIVDALNELDNVSMGLLAIERKRRVFYRDEVEVPISMVRRYTRDRPSQFPAASMNEIITELERRMNQLLGVRSSDGHGDEQIGQWVRSEINKLRQYLEEVR